MLGNIIAAIKFSRKFYHRGNIIPARNFDRSWNRKVSSKYFHIFNDFVISSKSYPLLQLGQVSAHQPRNKFCYIEATDSSLRASASVAMYSFPNSFPFDNLVYIEIVIYPCSKSNIQSEQTFLLCTNSLHLVVPVSIHFPTVGKSHSHGVTDPGESELLGVSDWGVTDKGSHSLLETVSNQIFWWRYIKRLPHCQAVFCSSVYYTERKPNN